MLRALLVFFCLITSSAHAQAIKDGLSTPYPAPEIAGITDWINSEPLTPDKLKGKVVLVDFWAYSCINCVRTLPYLNEWDKKYRDAGLVIIGVHASEFAFEKKLENVRKAVAKWHVTYPVALDNDQVTWNNFKNQFWPAHYLINRQGEVVYTHSGEGNYAVTEQNIRTLLGLDTAATMPKEKAQFRSDQTPETYLGYDRAEHFHSTPAMARDLLSTYHPEPSLPQDHWALEGKWTITHEKITAGENGAKLHLHFMSKKVFLVLGSATGKPIHATLTLNGKPLGKFAGKDAPDGKLIVEHHTLYELVAQDRYRSGTLEIATDEAGLEAYAFTFGE